MSWHRETSLTFSRKWWIAHGLHTAGTILYVHENETTSPNDDQVSMKGLCGLSAGKNLEVDCYLRELSAWKAYLLPIKRFGWLCDGKGEEDHRCMTRSASPGPRLTANLLLQPVPRDWVIVHFLPTPRASSSFLSIYLLI